jgi:hypothetical protein
MTVTITATHSVHSTEGDETNNLTVNCNAAPRTHFFYPPGWGSVSRLHGLLENTRPNRTRRFATC